MADRGLSRVVQYLIQTARGRAGGTLSDAQLLECYLSGRAEVAFEALVHRHGPMVLGVCRRVLRHEHDAEDAFQAVFLLLLRKGGSIHPRGKVGNWLYGVAFRIALKARSLRDKRQSHQQAIEDAPEPQTAEAGASADWLPLLDRELHGLPAKYRMPIILCDLEGKTQHDAARQLGWREGTLSGRLSRARVLLHRRLTRRGVTVSATALTATLAAQSATGALPATLAAATVKAASFVTIKQAVAAGAVTAQAALLTEGVLQAMLWTKIKTGVIGVLAMVVVMTGLGQALYTASGQTKGAGADATKDDGIKEIVVQGKGSKPPKAEMPSRRAQELESKLQATASFHYKDVTLGEVLDDLRKAYGINIFVDENTVARSNPDTPPPTEYRVSAQLTDMPLETALRFLLKGTPSSLGFVNQDGVLVITSRDKTMVRKVYPVGHLLGNAVEKNAVALIQVVVNTIEPESWTLVSAGVVSARAPNAFAPNGGGGGLGQLGGGALGQLGGGGIAGAPFIGFMGVPNVPMGVEPAQVAPPTLPNAEGAPAAGHGASIAYFPGTQALVVRQYPEVHREIEDLLKNLAE